MLALRCSNRRPRPSQCIRHAVGWPRFLTQANPPRSLGADHDKSALNGYLLRSRDVYPDIRPKLVEITANSPLFSPDRPLPISYLPGRMKPSQFASILQNDFDVGYWDMKGAWSAAEENIIRRQAEYKAHGDMFLQNVMVLMLQKYLPDSLPPGCFASFYKFINSHSLFRLILAFRLQLYCRREFRLFPPDPRFYRKQMITLQRWATRRIPVTSEDEFNKATQLLDNLERNLVDIADDDPDLEAAIRRVNPVLGARVLNRHISGLEMGPGLSAAAVISEDIEWLTDVCGDIMFLILHRGIKQAETDFKINGGVVDTSDTTTAEEYNKWHLYLDQVTEEGKKRLTLEDIHNKFLQMEDQDSQDVNDTSSSKIEETPDIPPYLRRVFQGIRGRIARSTASSSTRRHHEGDTTGKGWEFITEDDTAPEIPPKDQFPNIHLPFGAKPGRRNRGSSRSNLSPINIRNRLLKRNSRTKSADMFTNDTNVIDTLHPMYQSLTLPDPSGRIFPTPHGQKDTLDHHRFVSLLKLLNSNSEDSTEPPNQEPPDLPPKEPQSKEPSSKKPIFFGPALWKAPQKPPPPTSPPSNPQEPPTSTPKKGSLTPQTPFPIRRVDSSPMKTPPPLPKSSHSPFNLSTIQNLDSILHNLAAAKKTDRAAIKQYLKFNPIPPLESKDEQNEEAEGEEQEQEPPETLHKKTLHQPSTIDIRKLKEELEELEEPPKTQIENLKSQMQDLFTSIKIKQ
ncbi:hypothetical protein TWF102_000921 [Orbilia oligospora]|uniref:Uncharacterized protein n=1 Tax=Orbilia oligospora TaxID=2813651 RepID=A0A7C8NEL4_ORBOL|nr:hypothetical protein TWF102_000921 [Orbilia oligospora]KAF3117400.1 hypothetical protein TWF103_006148 [Orbilia oligospora]